MPSFTSSQIALLAAPPILLGTTYFAYKGLAAWLGACAGIPPRLFVLLDLLVLPVIAVDCRPRWAAGDVQGPAPDVREA